MFIIREVNSGMPNYILTEQMAEKIKCPERDSNPRHPDLIEGALTTELPRQPRWSESNICYKGNIDYQTFAPRQTYIDRHIRVYLSDDEHLFEICRITYICNGL